MTEEMHDPFERGAARDESPEELTRRTLQTVAAIAVLDREPPVLSPLDDGALAGSSPPNSAHPGRPLRRVLAAAACVVVVVSVAAAGLVVSGGNDETQVSAAGEGEAPAAEQGPVPTSIEPLIDASGAPPGATLIGLSGNAVGSGIELWATERTDGSGCVAAVEVTDGLRRMSSSDCVIALGCMDPAWEAFAPSGESPAVSCDAPAPSSEPADLPFAEGAVVGVSHFMIGESGVDWWLVAQVDSAAASFELVVDDPDGAYSVGPAPLVRNPRDRAQAYVLAHVPTALGSVELLLRDEHGTVLDRWSVR